jgi:hypothetical protein
MYSSNALTIVHIITVHASHDLLNFYAWTNISQSCPLALTWVFALFAGFSWISPCLLNHVSQKFPETRHSWPNKTCKHGVQVFAYSGSSLEPPGQSPCVYKGWRGEVNWHSPLTTSSLECSIKHVRVVSSNSDVCQPKCVFLTPAHYYANAETQFILRRQFVIFLY